MHILITGGSGFLGARLARTLLARGSVSRGGAAAQVITRITLADGQPMGLAGLDPSRPTPFVLGGIVSAVSPRSNEVYSTAVALPACSGSPLVAQREDGTWALAGLLLSLVGFQQTGPATQLFFGVARSAEVIGQALAHMRLAPPATRGDGGPPDRSNLN